MDGLVRWLADRLPVFATPTLVHNDFKLDNIMLDARNPGCIEAVLDWEMATVGDPLVDVGCTLCYWTQAGDPEMRGGSLSGVTAEPGWYTRAELVARYTEKSGRDVSALGYYEVFGLFKLGVILQQIYFRFHRGQTRDERFRDFHLRVRGLVRAWVEGRYDVPGKSWAAFRERVSSAAEALNRFASGESVAIFSSATPIAVWVGMALALQGRHVMRLAGVTYNAALTTMRVRGD